MNFSFGFGGNNYRGNFRNRNVVYFHGGPVSTIIMGLVFICAGIFVIFFSFRSEADYNKKDSTYTEATATIVDVLTRTESKRDIDTGMIEEYVEYAPVLEYKVDENTYRYTEDYSTNRVIKDEKIKIKYNPNNPNDIIIVNGNNYKLLLIMGIAFAVAGLIVVVSGVKKMYLKNDSTKTALNDNKSIDTSKQENKETSYETINNNIESTKESINLNSNTGNPQQTSIIDNNNSNDNLNSNNKAIENNNQKSTQSSISDLYKR